MNFVKKSLVEGIRSGVGTLKRVEALLLPASNLFAGLEEPASLFCSPMRLAGGLL